MRFCWQQTTSPDRLRAELQNSEEGRAHLAREQARVDAKRQAHRPHISEAWDSPLKEVLQRVEKAEDVTVGMMFPPRASSPMLQMEDFEDDRQMSPTQVDANGDTLPLPQAEEVSSDDKMFI